MLTQSLASHKDLLKLRTEQIDRLNEQLRDFSALQKADLERLQELKERVKLRDKRQAKVANLKRAIQDRRTSSSARKGNVKHLAPIDTDTEPTWLADDSATSVLATETPDGAPTDSQRQLLLNDELHSSVPARLNAYLQHNALLRRQADELKSRSSEVEALYRKVVSLCTGVEEGRVEGCLTGLVAAVESERGCFGEGEVEVGRVRSFLRRVEGGSG